MVWRWRIVFTTPDSSMTRVIEIKGRAAKWKMADWLVEKLDELAEFGYVEQSELQEFFNST